MNADELRRDVKQIGAAIIIVLSVIAIQLGTIAREIGAGYEGWIGFVSLVLSAAYLLYSTVQRFTKSSSSPENIEQVE